MSTEPLPEDTVPTWYVNLAVRWSTTLDADTKLLLLVLSDIADNLTAQIPPQREPSTAQLMRETSRGKDTVIDRRKKAEAAGWLRLERPSAAAMARHEPIGYQLLVPEGAEPPGIARPVLGEPSPRRTGGRRPGPGSATATPDSGSGTGTDGRRTARPGSAGATPGAEFGVGRSDPATSGRGRRERPPGVDGSDRAGSTGATPSFDVPSDGHDGFEKPSAAAADPAADRAARLAIAEELEQLFHARYGTSSAQPRGAVRSVIITAVVDKKVPRLKCARALDTLGVRGKQITRDSLTAQLGSMTPTNPRPLVEPEPDEEPAWARRGRYCTVRGHETTQLTPAGLCPNCAGDSRARAWGPNAGADQPPEPSLGALLLDHGGGYEVEMSRTEALAQQSRDRTYLEFLPDADHWRDLADEYLDAQHPNDDPDFVPHPGAVDAVAAELHRRWRRQARAETEDS